MSEIEFGATILMVIAAFGTTVLFGWHYQKLKRESLGSHDGVSGAQVTNVIVENVVKRGTKMGTM